MEIHSDNPPEIRGIREYHIRAGNKDLLLSVNRVQNFAESYISNTEGEQLKGVTTEIYREVKKILQNEANQIGAIDYRITTGFPSMKAWVKSSGDGIFHWERTYSSVDDPEKLIAETTIRPK